MRKSDAEEAARILKGRGYVAHQVAPDESTTPGLVVFVDPKDVQHCEPGVFGVVPVTAEDVVRHCHDPARRAEDLGGMCDKAVADRDKLKRRITNR